MKEEAHYCVTEGASRVPSGASNVPGGQEMSQSPVLTGLVWLDFFFFSLFREV